MCGKYIKVKKLQHKVSIHPYPRRPERSAESCAQLQQRSRAGARRAPKNAPPPLLVRKPVQNIQHKSGFQPSSFGVYVDRLCGLQFSVELTHCQPSNARREKQQRRWRQSRAVTITGAAGATATHHSSQVATRINTNIYITIYYLLCTFHQITFDPNVSLLSSVRTQTRPFAS